MEVHETLLPEVIQYDLPESENFLPEVIELEKPQPYLPESFGPSSSLLLSQIKPIQLGPNSEPLPYIILSIEDIPQEEPHPSTPIDWEGLHFHQNEPFPPPQP